ncbi:MAG: 1-deoxy-D-xylulose-5-phosphate synthase [Sedimentisphaerales bacterium]|nr:1-deoxy-D-xylulose-5-phosphate synthase [Sedimentisphaerales bacterium]
MSNLLDKINGPQDLHLLSVEELTDLADEIREFITHSVSKTGGHLASNLGVIELTIAMHYVFDFNKDKLLWDVGHQCYAHKILTSRKDKFAQLRKHDGLSGFPNPEESDYDVFSVGHAGTSISTAMGLALGAQHNKTEEKIVSLVGDASIVNGLSFEALNNLGLVKRQMLIVLNDNSMAIDATPGSVAKFLSKIRLSHTYEDLRKTTNNILEKLPLIGKKMEDAIESFKKTLRMAVSPSRLFESLNIPYFGPVDGHDIGSLIELFRAICELQRPAILHVYTKKGKGYSPADDNPSKFHSTGPFELNGDTPDTSKSKKTFTSAFSDTLVKLAQEDKKIIAITAAMTEGTGLNKFKKLFPDRFYDVGIAESIAVDIAAGMAKQGLKPIVCIYSTFLQRSYDQIFQEVALQDLPVVFCIDRSGFVGSDGPTHHGLMDIGFMRMMPNLIIISPADETEIKAALNYALRCGKSVAIRYPKDTIENMLLEPGRSTEPFETGKSVTVRKGSGNIVIAALGSILREAIKAADDLSKQGIDITVINARFAKPVDKKIVSLFDEKKTIITVEDHSIACGFGSAVLELIAKEKKCDDKNWTGRIINLGCPDKFIKADSRKAQLARIGISAEEIVKTVKKIADK